ncbi:hypothetical protein, partial [Pyxidicoccus fallax]
PEPEAPDVSSAEPADALGQIAGLPPAQLSQALGGVGQSVSRSVGGKREELAASPPELATPTGMPARPGAAGERAGASGEAPRRPEREPQAESAPLPGPEPTPEPPPSPLLEARAPTISEGEQGSMSSEDAAELGASIQSLPTSDPELSTSAGPAPTLPLEGGTDPAQVGEQRARVDERVAEAQAQGQADVAQPMGEDEIAPEPAAQGVLRAAVPGGGGGAGGAGAEGGEVDAATSIVAQEEHGEEIQSAVQQGQSNVVAEEARHEESEARERQTANEEADRLTSEAADAQRAEREGARADADAQREEWSEAQRNAVDQGREDADTREQETRDRVQQEREQGEARASEHIEQGEQEASRRREEGEQEAERHQQRGAQESSGGFFGWLASRARAFFDSIKQGIRAALQAARAAVRRAIDAAKRLAQEAIERARQAVVSAIRAAGDALIAIGDTVLAAFPEARARFRGFIERRVQAAEDAVNRIAAGLQEGIQRLLDGLGALLDQALGLLESGLMAIVDAVNSAVQGAISAARAAVEAIGNFAALIRDIAANPGQWIANLGAAVVDGIRNHLWRALKTAVSEWFNQKLEEVLGVGRALFNLLFRGGISLAAIGQMAWNALKAAIPTVLIQLLLEKLVSMIVPAAGAVMAIVEGIQAAWGTVSRILQALDRFMTFLRAVKTGSAGPQFANAVAAGAVAAIDFVANWLIARLRRPAGAVAGRLRAIGQRIMARLGRALRRAGRALRRVWGRVRRRISGRRRGGRRGRQQRRDRRREMEERLARAQRELTPRVRSLLERKPGRLRLRAQLLAWRLAYRLRRLDVQGGHESFSIVATVNPSITLAPGWSFDEMDVFRAVDKIAGEMLTEAQTEQTAAAAQAQPQPQAGAPAPAGPRDLRQFESPAAPVAALQPESSFIVGSTQRGVNIGYQHSSDVAPFGGWWGWQGVAGLEAERGRRYQQIAASLSGRPVGDVLTSVIRGQRPNISRAAASDVGELYGLWFAKEPSHNLGLHRRDLAYSFMVSELMTAPQRGRARPLTIEEGVAMHPASFGAAQRGARAVTDEMLGRTSGPSRDARTESARQERLNRERSTLRAWFRRHARDLPVLNRRPTVQDVEDFVREKLRAYIRGQR